MFSLPFPNKRFVSCKYVVQKVLTFNVDGLEFVVLKAIVFLPFLCRCNFLNDSIALANLLMARP